MYSKILGVFRGLSYFFTEILKQDFLNKNVHRKFLTNLWWISLNKWSSHFFDLSLNNSFFVEESWMFLMSNSSCGLSINLHPQILKSTLDRTVGCLNVLTNDASLKEEDLFWKVFQEILPLLEDNIGWERRRKVDVFGTLKISCLNLSYWRVVVFRFLFWFGKFISFSLVRHWRFDWVPLIPSKENISMSGYNWMGDSLFHES